jgi:DNA binding domain, excisionase family
MARRYYSVTQAAEALGISRQRVLQLIERKRFRAVKVGKTWLILSLDKLAGTSPEDLKKKAEPWNYW